jgi:anaerobic selenocysteine-containing dehydrogenase
MAYELLRLPGRVDAPLVEGKPARWPEALSRLADEIERQPAGSVGLVLGADATAEEAAAAGQFAGACLAGAPATVGFLANEAAVLAEAGAAPQVPETKLNELAKANIVVAVGDLFALCPVISRRVLDAKYGGRGNALVHLGRNEGLTARLASLKLVGASERRAALALLRELAAAGKHPPADASRALEGVSKAELGVQGPLAATAKALAGAGAVAVIAATADPVAVRLGKLIAAALGPRGSFLAMTEAAGARDILAAWRPETDLAGVFRAVRDGRLRGLVALGLDVVTVAGADGEAVAKLPLLAAGSAFGTRATKAARFVLPTRLWAEKSGTWAGLRREPAVAAPGLAQSYGWILLGLAGELGQELAGAPAAGEARPMSVEEAVRQAAGSAEGPRPGWAAREASDPMTRAALAGVYVA